MGDQQKLQGLSDEYQKLQEGKPLIGWRYRMMTDIAQNCQSWYAVVKNLRASSQRTKACKRFAIKTCSGHCGNDR